MLCIARLSHSFRAINISLLNLCVSSTSYPVLNKLNFENDGGSGSGSGRASELEIGRS